MIELPSASNTLSRPGESVTRLVVCFIVPTPSFTSRLLDEESAALGELEVLVGKPIRLQTESLYELDQYDVVLM